MTTATLPQATLGRGGPSRAYSVIAHLRTALVVVVAMWPLSATMLAVGAILVSL